MDILLEVGRLVPKQSRTRDKTYLKIGTPDSYPVFEVDLCVVPATGRTLNSYPIVIFTHNFNFLVHQHITYFVSVNVYCKQCVKISRHTTLD